MVELASVIFAVSMLIGASAFGLIALGVVCVIGAKFYPYLKSLRSKSDGKFYAHPDTGEAVTFEEAVKAEEEMFGGGVPYADWSNAITRNRH